jgi:hypothetical protein
LVAESLNESESIYFSELLIHTDFIYWSAYSSHILAAVESSIELLSTTVGKKYDQDYSNGFGALDLVVALYFLF